MPDSDSTSDVLKTRRLTRDLTLLRVAAQMIESVALDDHKTSEALRLLREKESEILDKLISVLVADSKSATPTT